jgi:uncharacterized Zn finger protein (UPF0148 family)
MVWSPWRKQKAEAEQNLRRAKKAKDDSGKHLDRVMSEWDSITAEARRLIERRNQNNISQGLEELYARRRRGAGP